jgi:hypothetical protein
MRFDPRTKQASLWTLALAFTLALAAASPQAKAAELLKGAELQSNWPFPFPFPGAPGQNRPGRPGRPDRPLPPQPPRGGDEYLHQNVFQRYEGDNIIPLRQVLGIGQQYQGRRVEFVVLRASTDFGRGQATVSVNQQDVTGAQTVGTRAQDYFFYLPQWADEIGTEIQMLQIALQGRFNVDSVGVKFARGGGGWNPPDRGGVREVAHIGRQFQGQNRIEIGQYANLDRYQGLRVRSVILRGQTARGMGDASFCGSRGCTTIQNVGTQLGDYQFPVSGDVVDWGARNWTVDLRGNFYVESIIFEFER